MRIYKKKDDKEVQIPKEEQVKKYKFSWMELVTNHKTGETSATGFCGILLVVVSLFLYVVLVGWYFFNMSHFTEVSEILDKLTTLIMIGAGLLGLRKATASFASGAILSLGGNKKKQREELEDLDDGSDE